MRGRRYGLPLRLYRTQGKVGDGVVNGSFYVPIGVRGDEGNAKLNDEAASKRLWEWMEGELKEYMT